MILCTPVHTCVFQHIIVYTLVCSYIPMYISVNLCILVHICVYPVFADVGIPVYTCLYLFVGVCITVYT